MKRILLNKVFLNKNLCYKLIVGCCYGRVRDFWIFYKIVDDLFVKSYYEKEEGRLLVVFIFLSILLVFF